ncbi:tetratricopeptide (TPR) repeat protein [Epilithonimonas hungarica]|uniref:tetratricopeptide repeat protein n=1 Tax=Epilithonimonas hungarica TaxID=454006 RepID=UPI002780AA74|nr:tetratricopeptide repeat protein [Epilithonimonas hungarica]MDP9957118.1 tetratricopeptide (TPR) repeat protein [Epilithonimonas hungarica]
MKKFLTLVFLYFFFNCFSQNVKQDSIIEKYTKKCAYQFHYLAQGWEDCINEGLKADSAIAIFWHHKALPLWKTRKYELALKSYDKAVKYNRKEYLGRRGFLKCIFLKNYTDALKDLDAATKEYGDAIQNDHSYDFYKSLCYLQLNDFDKALKLMQSEIDKIKKQSGVDWVSPLCYFYTGIIYYEKRDYKSAVEELDKALKLYPNFSDAEYYKALSLYKINNDFKTYLESARLAKKDYDKGLTFKEGDSPYEKYPYEVNWYLINLDD